MRLTGQDGSDTDATLELTLLPGQVQVVVDFKYDDGSVILTPGQARAAGYELLALAAQAEA
jgi:hypothetical protein